jgi:hypothetical protein
MYVPLPFSTSSNSFSYFMSKGQQEAQFWTLLQIPTGCMVTAEALQAPQSYSKLQNFLLRHKDLQNISLAAATFHHTCISNTY